MKRLNSSFSYTPDGWVTPYVGFYTTPYHFCLAFEFLCFQYMINYKRVEKEE